MQATRHLYVILLSVVLCVVSLVEALLQLYDEVINKQWEHTHHQLNLQHITTSRLDFFCKLQNNTATILDHATETRRREQNSKR